jgi:hypothetical protein
MAAWTEAVQFLGMVKRGFSEEVEEEEEGIVGSRTPRAYVATILLTYE